MGIGLVSIVTSQKKEQSGAPFAAGSADNGLSIDTTSGRIVLGNDVGDTAAPATLLSNREIVTEDTLLNLFGLLLNAIQTGIITTMDGQSITVAGADTTAPFITLSTGDNGNAVLTVSGGITSTSALTNITGAGGISNTSTLSGAGGLAVNTVQAGSDLFTIESGNLAGHVVFGASNFGVPILFFSVNTATINCQLGPTLRTDNGAALQVSGSLTWQLLLQSQGAGTYNIDRDLDSGKIFSNSAAANLAIPNMAGANVRPGFIIAANCFNVAGITITLAAGQTARFGALATTAGGTLSSVTLGSTIKIVLINSTTWVTESFTGIWVLT